MTREELEKRLNEAEKQNLSLIDEIKCLKEQLANVENEPEIPDIPDFKDGEEFFFVGSDLEKSLCRSMNTGMFKMDFNVFHTKIYAEEFRRKCQMIAMMMHCKWYVCRTHEPNWDNGIIQKWTVLYNHNVEKFTVESSRVREWSTIYFDTEENAQKCADWMNAHWKESTDE